MTKKLDLTDAEWMSLIDGSEERGTIVHRDPEDKSDD